MKMYIFLGKMNDFTVKWSFLIKNQIFWTILKLKESLENVQKSDRNQIRMSKMKSRFWSSGILIWEDWWFSNRKISILKNPD